jgi:hypothetical protein
MKFEIGQTILLNGKHYKIVGTKARSYLLEKDGKMYKATADKMTKIQNQNNAPVKSALEHKVEYTKIFNKDIKMPTNEAECAYWFDQLRCELSPENLCCDGEASRSQIQAKLRDINACWKGLETICGHKVSKDY